MTHEEMIQRCLDTFNFKKVAEAMQQMNWKWCHFYQGLEMKVPDEATIRQQAEDILRLCMKGEFAENGEPYECGTGGFWATYDPLRQVLELKFVVAHSTVENLDKQDI